MVDHSFWLAPWVLSNYHKMIDIGLKALAQWAMKVCECNTRNAENGPILCHNITYCILFTSSTYITVSLVISLVFSF